MSQTTSGISIVRIEELDTVAPEVLRDPLKTPWGVIEIEGKTYKFDLRAAIAILDGNDPRVPPLTERVVKLEAATVKLLLGIDENEVLDGSEFELLIKSVVGDGSGSGG